MYTLKFKIPLLMYSTTEPDPVYPSRCLILNMEDLDISQISGMEQLSGQYCWIYNYDEAYKYDKKKVDQMYAHAKCSDGFNLREVVMDVYFKDGYYIAEFVTELSLDTIVTYDKGYGAGFEKRVTLKEAIVAFLEGHLSDGIGENEIGQVSYNFHKYDVWLGHATEIQ